MAAILYNGKQGNALKARPAETMLFYSTAPCYFHIYI